MSKIVIFTDGSSLGNPGPGGWGAVVVFGKEKVLEMGGSEKNTTNNRMEMTAVIESLNQISKKIYPVAPPKADGTGATKLRKIASQSRGRQLNNEATISIYTDSSYVLNGITKWVRRWILKNWTGVNKKPILNRDLWQKLFDVSKNINIEWKLLPGHSGICGNERADEIAMNFAEGGKINLYSGLINKYGMDILSRKKSSYVGNRKTPYSYLSFVDGKIAKHKTWGECEKRVKGKSGAKFRKTMSQEDEAKIIDIWSV